MKLRIHASLLAILTITGCVRDIDIENAPARVTSIGPVDATPEGQVAIRYTIRDFEGDDQQVRVTICDADGEDCGPAVRGFGGDPTTRVTTVPQDTDVLHSFVWNPWCGRYLGSDLVEAELGEEYVAAAEIVSTDLGPIMSEPFTLESLGLEVAGDCE